MDPLSLLLGGTKFQRGRVKQAEQALGGKTSAGGGANGAAAGGATSHGLPPGASAPPLLPPTISGAPPYTLVMSPLHAERTAHRKRLRAQKPPRSPRPLPQACCARRQLQAAARRSAGQPLLPKQQQ